VWPATGVGNFILIASTRLLLCLLEVQSHTRVRGERNEELKNRISMQEDKRMKKSWSRNVGEKKTGEENVIK
jgi:hypothetical protein